MSTAPMPDYERRLAREAEKWASHLQLEEAGAWSSWCDHPVILENYRRRAQIDGMEWEDWIAKALGGPAERSLDLGCGSGGQSLRLFDAGATREVHGYDLTPERVQSAERDRLARDIPGGFHVADVNTLRLPECHYDLICSSHSFHHFLALEHIMQQVHAALRPGGLFVLNEYVGPTQFQWRENDLRVVNARLALLPERLRRLPDGRVKHREGRPLPSEVEAESPFESIRSGEIASLFHRHFQIVLTRQMGGNLQQLLHNGIIQNFPLNDAEAMRHLRGILALENTLVDSGMIESHFQLLVGRRKDDPVSVNTRRDAGSEWERLETTLRRLQASDPERLKNVLRGVMA
jgi:SAM-dependent methyltransferase